jgi:uncharacterized protein
MSENENEKPKVDYWERYLKREWSYVTGAVLLAVLATMLVVVNGKAWGVTGPFAKWGGLFLQTIGLNADAWSFYDGSLAKYTFWKDATGLTNLGIVLGALMAVLLAASFKMKKIKSWRQVAAAVLGGLLMGIGARMAMGCNIGAFFSAIPAFSLHGWVFGVFILLGAIVGSFMLKKWFM